MVLTPPRYLGKFRSYYFLNIDLSIPEDCSFNITSNFHNLPIDLRFLVICLGMALYENSHVSTTTRPPPVRGLVWPPVRGLVWPPVRGLVWPPVRGLVWPPVRYLVWPPERGLVWQSQLACRPCYVGPSCL